MDTPGKRLKYFRVHNKLTQRQLADILGMEWYQIKDMEAGKVSVSKQIAKLLYFETSINYNWLLTGEGEMYLNNHVPPEAVKSEEKRESDLEEKMKELEARLEARIALLEKLFSQSRPNPGRRWYDDVIGKKK